VQERDLVPRPILTIYVSTPSLHSQQLPHLPFFTLRAWALSLPFQVLQGAGVHSRPPVGKGQASPPMEATRATLLVLRPAIAVAP
jgi:hypothetical protein